MGLSNIPGPYYQSINAILTKMPGLGTIGSSNRSIVNSMFGNNIFTESSIAMPAFNEALV